MEFTDKSTASDSVKITRFLEGLRNWNNAAYWFDDGWPRPSIAADSLATQQRISALEAELATAQTDAHDRIADLDAALAQARQERDAAQVENKRLVGMNLAALLRIKYAADVLYSEAEEFDLPDGLGMGASQQYWDDLADALFPDDSGRVIQADLEKAQAAVDGAWKAFNEELNKPELLPCGHHHSLMLKSAETGEPLYCEYCDCIQRRNDAEKMERDLKLEIYNLKADKSQTLMEAERAMAQIREVNLKMWAERDALRKAWECAKRQNAHDMLLSGDEIHQHDAAIQQARGAK